MVLSDNKHFRTAHTDIERVRDGEPKLVVVITTDLELDPRAKAYDKREVDRFMTDVDNYIRENGHVERVRVVTGH
jgi:hypothetical protein